MSATWPDGADVHLGEYGPCFHTLVQHASDIITILDSEGIVRYESDAIMRVLGYRPEELIGTDPFVLIHPDDVSATHDLFQKVVRTQGMSTTSRFRFRHRDDSWRWLEVIVTNLLDDPGIRGVVINSRDVTDRQRTESRLRDSEQRFRNLYAEAHRQAQELALLGEVRTALAHELELSDLFRTVVGAIARTFGYTLVSLYVLENNVLVLQHQVGYDQVAERIPVTKGVSGRVVRTGEAVLLADVRTDAAFIGAIPGIISEVCVPLCDEDQAVGTLNLESRDGVHLTDADLHLMMALSEHVNVAIGRARLYTEARRSEARFRALVQHAADIIIVQAVDGTRHYISPSVEHVLGYRPEELVGNATDLRHPDDQARAHHFFADVVAHPGEYRVTELRIGRRDGSWGWFEVTATNLLTDPSVSGIVFNAREITERKHAEDALRRSEASLVEAQRLARLGSWEWHIPSNHITWSDELYRIVGTPREELDASYEGYLACVHPEDRLRVEGIIGHALVTREDFEIEHRMVGTSGAVSTIDSIGVVLLDAEGRVTGLRVTTHDVSDRKRLEEDLRYQAFHDGLTDLPNRMAFVQRLEDVLLEEPRSSQTVAVFFLDLDRFKVVNDSLGHLSGDHMLVAVTARLSSLLRHADTVARFGGDEFAVLLVGHITLEEIEKEAHRIVEAFHAPFVVDGRELFITASVGISLQSSAFSEAAHLLQAADVAMYHAKAGGPGGYAVFDSSMNSRAVEQLELEADLQRAVERHELVLHYQPKIELASGAIVAVEALLRWHHPKRGLLHPGSFLQLAEDTGLIVPIGRWVLGEACRQARAWRAASVGSAECRMCVNLSAREFRQPDLVAEVVRVLEETGLPPDALELEITEHVAVHHDEALSTLLQLKAMGMHLALDDFGTGHSALISLQRLPIETLKIDRSFIQEVTTDAKTRAVVQAITTLAHDLGIVVVAEGVETEDQLHAVRNLGIDIVQGAYFAKALPSADCSIFLATRGANRI